MCAQSRVFTSAVVCSQANSSACYDRDDATPIITRVFHELVGMIQFLRPPSQAPNAERRGFFLQRRSYFLWPSQADAMEGNRIGSRARTGHRRNAFEVLNQLLARRLLTVSIAIAPPPPLPPPQALSSHAYDGAPIDLVYTWLDPTDPTWLELHAMDSANDASSGASLAAANSGASSNESSTRFRDYNELFYSLMSFGRFAPWIRRIHVVVCCKTQRPTWLDQLPLVTRRKITFVQHADIFPSTVLPRGKIFFNSNAIECYLHRIDGLAERFLYFNNDMMLNDFVSPTDFYAQHPQSGAVSPRMATELDDTESRIWKRDTFASNGSLVDGTGYGSYFLALYNAYYLLDAMFGYEPRDTIAHQESPSRRSAHLRISSHLPHTRSIERDLFSHCRVCRSPYQRTNGCTSCTQQRCSGQVANGTARGSMSSRTTWHFGLQSMKVWRLVSLSKSFRRASTYLSRKPQREL